MHLPHIHVMTGSGIRVGVLGASGTTGGELLRLVLGHPTIDIAFAGGRDSAGASVASIHPHLRAIEMQVEPLDAVPPLDAAFIALPHGESAAVVPDLLDEDTRVVDLGGDFRLPADAYPAWYGFEHPATAWLGKAVYGLTERFRDDIAGAALVANPGCFPTAVVLGVAPLLQAGLLEPAPLHVDGKTGLSGAGKRATTATSHLATEESVRPYRFPNHQHTPEIEHAIGLATGIDVSASFVPHLVPAVRGVVTTTYARAASGVTTGDLIGTLADAYAGEPFVRVLGPGEMADTKRVRGSNAIELQAVVDERTSTAIVVGALDNLVKGAAGQAIQNLNVMFDLGETTGLPTVGVYP